MKKADLIRLNNFDKKINAMKDDIIEYQIIQLMTQIIKHSSNEEYGVLNYVLNIKIKNLNIYVQDFAKNLLDHYVNQIENYNYIKKLIK